MGYAKKVLKPLSQVAVIDEATISAIAAQVTGGTHPATHPATMIIEDSSHRFVTDSEKQTWNSNDVSGKVDKITGKGLSTEDYTTVEKNKLTGLSNSGGLTQSQILIRQL